MKYLIVQDWKNTSDNHAGMKYLCLKIKEMYPSSYDLIIVPSFDFSFWGLNNRITRRLSALFSELAHFLYVRFLFIKLLFILKDEDSIFIMEYMSKVKPMLFVAKWIKQMKNLVTVNGMVHLVPSQYDIDYPTRAEFFQWVDLVDNLITLGSSLSNYLIDRGVPRSKVHTSFHYVDEYYFNTSPVRENASVQVLVMGNMRRKTTLLKQIVLDNPTIRFVICQGLADYSSLFHNVTNVELVPFISEDSLRDLMRKSDISLAVMDDTIGSNVIVTSLAMGLAMVCSDVGSIRDYCNQSNTFFCKNESVKDFSEALRELNTNRSLLKSMQLASFNASKQLSIERFVKSLNCLS